MTTIDHRILIPVPQVVVWEYIRKLSNNAKWQIDCKTVSILTSMSEGVGTRYRAAGENGREYVVEVRAWYDGLGYEYTFVDRPPFRDVTGRIRLQEIPEGTIIQWTLAYEMGGVLGGMRNSLGTARALDTAIQGSLKKLYLQLKTDRARVIDPQIETKSLMRDAPDADSRAQYKPRHPSALPKEDAPLTKPLQKVEIEGIKEPALEEFDTRPNVAAPATESATAPVNTTEPDFLDGLEITPSPDSTLPSRTEAMGHAQMIDVTAVQRELEEIVPPTPLEADTADNVVSAHSASAPAAPTTATPDARRKTDERRAVVVPPEDVPSPPAIVIPEPAQTDSQRLFDTSKMSIWEVFGVPRPSDTQEMVALQQVTAPAAPTPTTVAPPPAAITALPTPPVMPVETVAHPRVGWRAKQRQGIVRLRRP
jgi:hypothetical protein